ncbi:MAG TPA: type IV pilus twitching motility protein PilT [Acidimicrobiia bacterium]|jgi:twitching motility protein PilT
MAEVSSTSIEPLLQQLWDRRATDLLITVGTPPLVRVDGALAPLDLPVLTSDDTERLVSNLLGTELGDRFKAEYEVDFAFSWGDRGRFRGNAFHQRGCAALALRLIPFQIPTFEQLGLPPIADELVELPQGLVLVTGPTGSGKSTTLASMLDVINANRPCHIVTIEDPIEYVHNHKRAAVNQREVGTDTESFPRALRSAFREDPDVLLVGEMRDNETIQTALTIAETGHLVFATLHTNDAAQTLDRIVDVFPGEQQSQIRVQLAGALQAVMSQRLIPRLGGGRVAAFEVLMATFAVRNIVRDGRTNQLRNIISTGSKDGMLTLEASLTELVASGVVSYEQAVTHTLFPNEVSQGSAPTISAAT